MAWVDLKDSEEIFRVQGPDHVSFLSNYTTQDIKSLEPGQAALTAFLTQKGKLVTDAVILRTDDAVLLVWGKGYGEKVLAHLEVFINFAEVEFLEATEDCFHLAVVGEDAVSRFSATQPDSGEWRFSTDRFGLPNVEVIGKREKAKVMVQELNSLKIPQTALGALEYDRIRGGIPKMGIDMNQNHLVAEVGLDRRATSFNKGCYLGQETTARVNTQGHVNRKLKRFQLKKPPPALPVAIFQGEKEVGTLTSAQASPKGETTLGLGIIQTKALETQEPLHLQIQGESIGLEILDHDGS